MAIIEILQMEGTPEEKLKERIDIPEIQASRIDPVNIEVGQTIPMTELQDFINKIKPIEVPKEEELEDHKEEELEDHKEEELEDYFAMKISVYYDGNLSSKDLDIPHHIALCVVLESIMQKYKNSLECLHFRIS